ncbi:MAG TPA: rod shape-determining protein [Patescibacteria group bacterium]
MAHTLLGKFQHLIGIDLGTARTRMWHSKQGFMIDEATCLAVDTQSRKVIAVGDEAAAMRGRVSQEIKIIEPVAQGEIAEPAYVKAFLQVLLQRVFTSFTFFRPAMMIAVPATATLPMRELTTRLLYEVGAQEVFTISQPLAGAIGAGVPIADASGTFIVQMGQGIVEGAVISLGSLVKVEKTYLAGQYWDELIAYAIQDTQHLLISHQTAQQLKSSVVSLAEEELTDFITGQSLKDLSPVEVQVSTSTFAPHLARLMATYHSLITQLLSQVPPELTGDSIDKGLLLSGGLAQAKGLDEYLINKLGIPVSLVEEPEKTVIKGIATAMENIDEFSKSLGYRV